MQAPLRISLLKEDLFRALLSSTILHNCKPIIGMTIDINLKLLLIASTVTSLIELKSGILSEILNIWMPEANIISIANILSSILISRQIMCQDIQICLIIIPMWETIIWEIMSWYLSTIHQFFWAQEWIVLLKLVLQVEDIMEPIRTKQLGKLRSGFNL